MTIRTILVPMRDDGKSESLMDHGLALARRFYAHLEIVHCRPRPENLLPYGVPITTTMRKTIMKWSTVTAQKHEARLKTKIEDHLAANGVLITTGPPAPDGVVSASWREEAGRQAEIVAIRGRLADLILVARPDSGSGLGQNTLEAALVETGKLVLMCPPAAAGMVGLHVAIGWNGSAVAARAVTAALPLLISADKVTGLSTPTGLRDQVTAKDLADYLCWHDIKADMRIVEAREPEVGQALLSESQNLGADVLLIGGYSHSRGRELLMGGVTLHIIQHADIPVLMLH